MKSKSPILDKAMREMKRDHCIPKQPIKTKSCAKNQTLYGVEFYEINHARKCDSPDCNSPARFVHWFGPGQYAHCQQCHDKSIASAKERVTAKTKKHSIAEIIADGLDNAEPSKKGFGIEHLRAVNLANAAPDLLEACEFALKADDLNDARGRATFPSQLRCALADAVSKAKGEL